MISAKARVNVVSGVIKTCIWSRTDERFPNEFLVTVGAKEVEQVAKLKANDIIKIGLSFFVREFTTREGKEYQSQSITGWGIEVVQVSGF